MCSVLVSREQKVCDPLSKRCAVLEYTATQSAKWATFENPARDDNGDMKRLLSVWLVLSTLFSTLAAAQLELIPSSSAVYTASDPSGRWSGRAPFSSLEFRFDPYDLRAAQLSVVLQPGKFDSGNFIRDANARRALFETGQYPDIRFDLARVQTAKNSLADGETLQVTLFGTLTMHGVSREVTTTATLRRADPVVTATGTLAVNLSDYGMKRPSLFGVKVDDRVAVAFDIQARAP